MFDDAVLAGVRAAREAFAAAHDYDIEKMVAYLKAKNDAGDRVVVSLPPRPPVSMVIGHLPTVPLTPQSAPLPSLPSS
jgi:hypothetical protein